MDDLKCIRKEFISRGWCPKKIRNVDPTEPLVTLEKSYKLPVVNYSAVSTDETITGLSNGIITEF